jgi:acyl carrier protein phosphodiesterase
MALAFANASHGLRVLLGIHRQVDVRTQRDPDPPKAHRARRVEARRLAKGALSLVVIEAVDEAKPWSKYFWAVRFFVEIDRW